MSTEEKGVEAGCPFPEGQVQDILDTSFLDPAVQEKPYPYYRALRATSSIRYSDSMGMYLVSRHDDLQTILRDPITFSQELGYYKQMANGHLDEMKEILEREGGGFFPDVVNIDPPRHTRVRKLLMQAFNAKRMKALEPKFEALVDSLIDDFRDGGKADGLHDLATPMAISFSLQLLEIDDLPMSSIKCWGSAYLSQFSMMQTREQMISAATDLSEMQRYLIELVRKKMAAPGDDMLSDIINARVPGEEPLGFEEIVATARALLINTHDSLSTAFSTILFKVATEPDIAKQFYESADSEVQMSRLIEEILRIEPPVRALSRVTTKAVTVGGTDLPEGAHLLILFASGNDDEAVFECPRHFDSKRENLGKSLTFGSGVHLCLGIALARMQLRVAARQTARKLKDLQLAIPAEDIRYVPNVALLAMERLPLSFSVAG